MSRPACTVPRWLLLLVAALALLCGSGAHEALHHFGTALSGERPVAPFEAHDAGCGHRSNAPVHEHSVCMLCKSGGVQHVALPHCAPRIAPLVAALLVSRAADALASPALVPGSIGARAPPVTVG